MSPILGQHLIQIWIDQTIKTCKLQKDILSYEVSPGLDDVNTPQHTCTLRFVNFFKFPNALYKFILRIFN